MPQKPNDFAYLNITSIGFSVIFKMNYNKEREEKWKTIMR